MKRPVPPPIRTWEYRRQVEGPQNKRNLGTALRLHAYDAPPKVVRTLPLPRGYLWPGPSAALEVQGWTDGYRDVRAYCFMTDQAVAYGVWKRCDR